MKILKKDYECETSNLKGDIKKILEKVKGSNIINFSKFVDDSINTSQLNRFNIKFNKFRIAKEIGWNYQRKRKWDKFLSNKKHNSSIFFI